MSIEIMHCQALSKRQALFWSLLSSVLVAVVITFFLTQKMGLALSPIVWIALFLVNWKIMLLTLMTVMTFIGVLSFCWLRGGMSRHTANQIAAFIGIWFINCLVLWSALLMCLHFDEIIVNPLIVMFLAYTDYVLAASFIALALSIVLIMKYCSNGKFPDELKPTHFASTRQIHQSGLFKTQGLALGQHNGKRLHLPGFESLLLVAPTGSGKTTSVALPNTLAWTGSLIVNDMKGELYYTTSQYRHDKLNQKCHILTPTIANMTDFFNPFAFVSSDPDYQIRDCQRIAEVIIHSNSEHEKFWTQASREIFLLLSLYLFETGTCPTISKIFDLSQQADFWTWLGKLLLEEDDELSETCKQLGYSILNADERTQKNILKDFHALN